MKGLTQTEQGVLIDLKVVPRASRDEIKSGSDGSLRVRLQAPPVDGKANSALVKFLAVSFDVPRRCVTIISGETSRTKRILVAGKTLRELYRSPILSDRDDRI